MCWTYSDVCSVKSSGEGESSREAWISFSSISFYHIILIPSTRTNTAKPNIFHLIYPRTLPEHCHMIWVETTHQYELRDLHICSLQPHLSQGSCIYALQHMHTSWGAFSTQPTQVLSSFPVISNNNSAQKHSKTWKNQFITPITPFPLPLETLNLLHHSRLIQTHLGLYSWSFYYSFITVSSSLTSSVSSYMIMDRHVSPPYPLVILNSYVFKPCSDT